MDISNSECLFFLNVKKKEEDCRSTPHIHNLSGCAILWDKLACWEPTAFGTTVNLTCPDYVPFFNNHLGRVWRNCTTDGWSDEFPTYMDACDYKANDFDQAEYKMLLTLKDVYTVGYSTSLSALLLAILILLAFRRLHCTRNYIHVNFFFSFILRGISIFAKDIFVLQKDCETPLVWCRSFMVFLHYCVMASFSWMLVEAIYLQMLLSVSFSTHKSFWCYVLLGWGAPAFFATIWLLYQLKYNNNGCWILSKNNSSWWIINGPIFISIIINVIIFLYIIKVLIMKLRLPVGGSSTSHKFRRLAKATLLLIPLLGIHFSFFAFIHIKFHTIFELCTASFQGLVVAILYCFLNAEVQTQLKAAWSSWFSNRQLQGQPTQQQQPPSTLSEDHIVTQETI